MSAFHIDGRISLKMEYELAIRLGEYIAKTNPTDKQIAALGWRLARLAEEEQEQDQSRFESDWERPAVPVARENSGSVEKFPVMNMREKVAAVRAERTTDKVRWGY